METFLDWLVNTYITPVLGAQQRDLNYHQMPPQITRHHGTQNWLNDDETLKRRAMQVGVFGPFAPLLEAFRQNARDRQMLEAFTSNYSPQRGALGMMQDRPMPAVATPRPTQKPMSTRNPF